MSDYKIYTIRQGSKSRVIQSPNDPLKSLQRNLLGFFGEYDAFYPGCTAREGMSTVANAAPHQGARILFKTDIKSFYPSITLHHLLRNLDRHGGNRRWIERARSEIVHCLISVKGELVLPTGAPTSPILSCIAATDLDHSLAEIASQFGFIYTRYIDDLTFSSKEERKDELESRVKAAIWLHGFECNYKKTKWLTPDSDDQFSVTGISLVDDRRLTGVPKEIRRICRARLDKVALNNIPLDKVTQGYMSYIQMIDRSVYLKLQDYLETRKARYAAAINPTRPCSSTQP